MYYDIEAWASALKRASLVSTRIVYSLLVFLIWKLASFGQCGLDNIECVSIKLNECLLKLAGKTYNMHPVYSFNSEKLLKLSVCFQDASLLDQVESEILSKFNTMRTPAPKMTKIRELLPLLTLRIPPHLVNYVSLRVNLLCLALRGHWICAIFSSSKIRND